MLQAKIHGREKDSPPQVESADERLKDIAPVNQFLIPGNKQVDKEVSEVLRNHHGWFFRLPGKGLEMQPPHGQLDQVDHAHQHKSNENAGEDINPCIPIKRKSKAGEGASIYKAACKIDGARDHDQVDAAADEQGSRPTQGESTLHPIDNVKKQTRQKDGDQDPPAGPQTGLVLR